MSAICVGSDGSNEVSLHYEDYGSGAPVVLIHGWPLSGRSWEPQLVPLVQAGHRVIGWTGRRGDRRIRGGRDR